MYCSFELELRAFYWSGVVVKHWNGENILELYGTCVLFSMENGWGTLLCFAWVYTIKK